jgi:hypothetical protein
MGRRNTACKLTKPADSQQALARSNSKSHSGNVLKKGASSSSLPRKSQLEALTAELDSSLPQLLQSLSKKAPKKLAVDRKNSLIGPSLDREYQQNSTRASRIDVESNVDAAIVLLESL